MSSSGRSIAAMIAIENSIEGGVSAAQDALATMPGLRIIGEYLVPVNFVLVAREGTTLADVHVVNAHPVAYAQSRRWLDAELPDHGHIPATSNVQAAASLFEGSQADAAVAPPGITEHLDLVVLAEDIGDNPNAVTRFVLVSRPHVLAEPTGADKTSLIVELPDDDAGRAARDARAVLHARREPLAPRVAADRRRPRPVPLRRRPRRPHRRRARRRRVARPAPHEPQCAVRSSWPCRCTKRRTMRSG